MTKKLNPSQERFRRIMTRIKIVKFTIVIAFLAYIVYWFYTQ